jgi:anaerobic ribonucleoside-triphosphate reductase
VTICNNIHRWIYYDDTVYKDKIVTDWADISSDTPIEEFLHITTRTCETCGYVEYSLDFRWCEDCGYGYDPSDYECQVCDIENFTWKKLPSKWQKK